ncbi:hypothetical protein MTP99_011308 [Tenebrio molitor]|nr:hypothetical protein MTP99_011308 [Tenebrio molitor]
MLALNPPQNQSTLNVIITITNDEKERDLRLAYYIAMHSSICTVDHLGQFHSGHLPTPIPSPTIHLTPSTSSEPAPNTPPTPLPTPDFRPVRSPSERTRSSPVSGPFAPLPRHTPTGSLATPPRGSSRADRRKYEHPLIFLAAEDIPQVTGTIPGGSRLHQVVPLVHSLTPGRRHSAELPRPCGVPPQPKKGTGARGIPRPTGVKLHPVTSPPEVIVT